MANMDEVRMFRDPFRVDEAGGVSEFVWISCWHGHSFVLRLTSMNDDGNLAWMHANVEPLPAEDGGRQLPLNSHGKFRVLHKHFNLRTNEIELVWDNAHGNFTRHLDQRRLP